MRYATRVAALVCLGGQALLAGCMSLARTEPAQQHYVLGAGASLPDATPPDVVFDLAIGIRRLKLASYLASPFMVVRRGANQVEFAEFNRWGEPLEAGINRMVAAALVEGGFREVAVAPWPAQARFGYVIQLDVVRFEGLALGQPDQPDLPDPVEGGVLLLATWEVFRQADGQSMTSGITDYQRSGWRVGDYAGLVTLLDEGLRVMAADLAAAMAGLPPILGESSGR